LRNNTQAHNKVQNNMSKTKIVEAFEQTVSDCSGLGGYNPGSPNLTIQSLNNYLINAKQAVDDANVSKSALDKVTNEREVEFDALPKLVSSIIFTLIASGANAQTLNDARFFLRQITGRKRKSSRTVPVADAATAKETSGEQGKISRGPSVAYASRADQFGKLVKLVSAESTYATNEAELVLSGLNQKLARIQQLNSSVIQARSDWSTKKIARDKKLYGTDSIIAVGRSVQKYVRAAYGLRSAEYTKIGKFSFTKP
jgi:hypothetical protein